MELIQSYLVDKLLAQWYVKPSNMALQYHFSGWTVDVIINAWNTVKFLHEVKQSDASFHSIVWLYVCVSVCVGVRYVCGWNVPCISQNFIFSYLFDGFFGFYFWYRMTAHCIVKVYIPLNFTLYDTHQHTSIHTCIHSMRNIIYIRLYRAAF